MSRKQKNFFAMIGILILGISFFKEVRLLNVIGFLALIGFIFLNDEPKSKLEK